MKRILQTIILLHSFVLLSAQIIYYKSDKYISTLTH